MSIVFSITEYSGVLWTRNADKSQLITFFPDFDDPSICAICRSPPSDCGTFEVAQSGWKARPPGFCVKTGGIDRERVHSRAHHSHVLLQCGLHRGYHRFSLAQASIFTYIGSRVFEKTIKLVEAIVID